MAPADRVFVGIRLPAAVVDAVVEATGPARAVVPHQRWVPREQLHVTLQFLGEVAEADAVAGALAALGERVPFCARLGGRIGLPSRRRARIVALGFVEGADEMTALAAVVGEALVPLGYAAEERPFRAHVTVARRRGKVELTHAVDSLPVDPVGPAFTVGEVEVFESRMQPGGRGYESLATVALAASTAAADRNP